MTADGEEKEDTAKQASRPDDQPGSNDPETKDISESTTQLSHRTRISTTELREKILREKLVAMRRTSNHLQ